MKQHQANKENVAILKSIVREPYAWPGGYERMAITNDGALLCSDCLKKKYRTILHSTKYLYNDGWQVNGSCYEATPYNEEFESAQNYCSNCNKQIGELS